MLLLGASYIALGVAFWFHDKASLDLLLSGIGVFVVLIGAGLYWGVPWMLNPRPKNPPRTPTD
ncbi:MAG: hypothetical protein L3K11_03520 [Thermoplasmata archaeon]|nr:hypothetical protein [Thermoplasmata archaeon]